MTPCALGPAGVVDGDCFGRHRACSGGVVAGWGASWVGGGYLVVVCIEEEDYLAGLEDCKNHLNGKIILSKGDTPLTHLDLTKKVQLVENARTMESYTSWQEFL